MKMLQSKVKRNEGGMTLIDFLASMFSISRKKAKKQLDERNVFVNGRRVWMARHVLKNGDLIEAQQLSTRTDVPTEPRILYSDNHYLVANKPSGLVSNGRDSLESRIQSAQTCPQIVAAHRLDKSTTGCLLLARTPDAMAAAIELFRSHKIGKSYHVLVAGRLSRHSGTIRQALEDREAITHITVLDANKIASHLLARIETGRTHQIRKHLSAANHPVLGDRSYGRWDSFPAHFRRVPRQMLHAATLDFTNPITGRRLHVNAPIPRDFRDCMAELKLR